MKPCTASRKRPTLSLRASGLSVLFGAVMLLMLATSLRLSSAAGMVPRIVLALTLALLLCELAVEWRTAGLAHPPESGIADPRRRSRAMAGAAWIGALLLTTWLLGVTGGCVLFCVAWLRFHARERWLLSLAVACGFGLVTWLVFSAALSVELYPGLIGRYLG